jgi:hypothetical protein
MVALALLSSLLLAASALAVPSSTERHSARVARRAHQSQPQKPYTGRAPLASSSSANSTHHDEYSSNWAGAVYNWPTGWIQAVTASFVVPTPSNPPGGNDGTTYYASAWVGIDGDTCGNAILQTGLDFSVQGGSVGYDGKPSFFCDGQITFTNSGLSVVRVVPSRVV